ncbi:hypothetical protein MUK42_07186 [Musa troglodytarum]|uniref:Uncharacterized protein n=1 Tax=Musa troglodytarum TaxID=320322 RepID=A0A9E7HWS7_9LILI|nr:hypothetical protein MUK42_07186 [Musa troglodytarum]
MFGEDPPLGLGIIPSHVHNTCYVRNSTSSRSPIRRPRPPTSASAATGFPPPSRARWFYKLVPCPIYLGLVDSSINDTKERILIGCFYRFRERIRSLKLVFGFLRAGRRDWCLQWQPLKLFGIAL